MNKGFGWRICCFLAYLVFFGVLCVLLGVLTVFWRTWGFQLSAACILFVWRTWSFVWHTWCLVWCIWPTWCILAYLVFCLVYLVFGLLYLVFGWHAWCFLVYMLFVGVLGVLVGVLGGLYNWDIALVTFRIGSSDVFITKDVQILNIICLYSLIKLC